MTPGKRGSRREPKMDSEAVAGAAGWWNGMRADRPVARYPAVSQAPTRALRVLAPANLET
jgi:hypothetical protein